VIAVTGGDLTAQLPPNPECVPYVMPLTSKRDFGHRFWSLGGVKTKPKDREAPMGESLQSSPADTRKKPPAPPRPNEGKRRLGQTMEPSFLPTVAAA
jgi:hypothetical protein